MLDAKPIFDSAPPAHRARPAARQAPLERARIGIRLEKLAKLLLVQNYIKLLSSIFLQNFNFANFGGLVPGCIKTKFFKKISV